MSSRNEHPTGIIETLLVAPEPTSLYTYPVVSAQLSAEAQSMSGNSRHGGLLVPADVRAPSYHKKQDIILNRQAISLVGAEDLDYIADKLDLNDDAALAGLLHRFHEDDSRGREVPVDYHETLVGIEYDAAAIKRLFLAQCLGANMVISSFAGTGDKPTFLDLKPGTDVGPFDPASSKFTGASVMLTRTNAPCSPPGKLIETTYDADVPGMAKEVRHLRLRRRLSSEVV